MTVTSLHERELTAILSGFTGFIEQHADADELEQLYHAWIPLLSTYVTHDSVESAIDEWYAFIQNDSLWLHYIEEQLSLTAKPFVRDTLEKWKQPFVFAGHQTPDGLYTCWSDQSKWHIEKESTVHVMGIALPMTDQSVLLAHSFETDVEFEELLEEGFAESKEMMRQTYLNRNYLTCISFLSDNT